MITALAIFLSHHISFTSSGLLIRPGWYRQLMSRRNELAVAMSTFNKSEKSCSSMAVYILLWFTCFFWERSSLGYTVIVLSWTVCGSLFWITRCWRGSKKNLSCSESRGNHKINGKTNQNDGWNSAIKALFFYTQDLIVCTFCVDSSYLVLMFEWANSNYSRL